MRRYLGTVAAPSGPRPLGAALSHGREGREEGLRSSTMTSSMEESVTLRCGQVRGWGPSQRRLRPTYCKAD